MKRSRDTSSPAIPTLPSDQVLADALALVPRSARRVLDIGCGTGELGRAIKARQVAEVTGLEVDPGAARVASACLDKVVLGEFDRQPEPFAPGQFDCIVCLDLLPYLREPAELLRRARRWLSEQGSLIARVPNVRHHQVVEDLLEGRWSYRVEGKTLRPQLRFFTRRESEKLFYRAGFTLPEMHPSGSAELEAWRAGGRVPEVKLGPLHIAGLSAEEAEEFYVPHYLVCARPRKNPDYGLTSIVILAHNELACTRECLDSIRLRTDEPYEIIVVDNGSTDGTPAYLQRQADVTLILNKENRGFPAAANQSIRASHGSQVLLLNNDTVVTTGWLGRMLAALYSDPAVALVGPCSNHVSGEQQVGVRYDADLVGLDGFAWDWGKAHHGVYEDTDRLVGFCLLFRRELVDRIGLLDERFGIGCYEDDDFCLRALASGYRAVIARDAFVHHYGSRTFRNSGVNFAALMQQNHQLFCDKWKALQEEQASSPLPSPARSSPAGEVPSTQAGGRPAKGHLELSLCMIVRDSARTLPACLESIKPWVDEMIVVDTGSTDNTPEIAAQFGAKVLHFPWCDSFSAARNESLRHASGRWLFWMDSDDVIDADNGRKLRELASQQTEANVLGYVMQVHCPGPGSEGRNDITVVDHVKLFRNDPALRFEGRIHEQILPAIRRAGGEVAWTDIHVVHAGYDHSPEGQAQKLRRDLHLLNLELQEQPDHPFTLFNLGMTHADQGEYAQAVAFLQRSIAQAGPDESHLRKAYALLVASYAQLGRHEAARQSCQRARELFPRDAELRFREAMLLHEAGRLDEAAQAYRDLLEQRDERHFSSIDRGIGGFKARQNLAVVLQDMGNWPAAEEQWRQITEEVPEYRSGWGGLGESLLRQNKLAEATALAEKLRAEPARQVEGLLLEGQLAAARGQWAEACRFLQEAMAQDPGDTEAVQRLARLLFEHGEPARAEEALRELVRRDPKDAAAHFNLGTLYLREGRFTQAVDAYRGSLECRPRWVPSYVQLGHALHGAGRRAEAASAWEEVLRLEPGHAEAAQALEQLGSHRTAYRPAG